MKIAIEPFLIDNALMNYCVYALAAAWMGVRIRLLPTAAVSVLGAVYALLSTFYVPALQEPYWKLGCFFGLSLLLFKRVGPAWKIVPFLALSAALTGGTAMLLTLQLGGTVYANGTIVGTVPVRTALLSVCAASCLPRIIRGMLSVRKKRSLHTVLVVRLSQRTYTLDALIDSGNLLKEPLSGLPVILIDREIDRPTRPIPFYKLSGSGVLYGERPVSAVLPQFGNAAVDCICARSPEPIRGAEAIMPESILPYEWRTRDDRMAVSYLGAPAVAAARWQTQYLMVRSHKRRPAAAARSGGRGALHSARADRQGSEG
jgi:hypothetical protein